MSQEQITKMWEETRKDLLHALLLAKDILNGKRGSDEEEKSILAVWKEHREKLQWEDFIDAPKVPEYIKEGIRGLDAYVIPTQKVDFKQKIGEAIKLLQTGEHKGTLKTHKTIKKNKNIIET